MTLKLKNGGIAYIIIFEADAKFSEFGIRRPESAEHLQTSVFVSRKVFEFVKQKIREIRPIGQNLKKNVF